MGGVPELPRSSKYVATPDAELGEAERNTLVSRLNQAFSAGIVDETAYRAHLDTLFAAKRLGDVAGVVAILPAIATHDVPAVIETGRTAPGDLAPARSPKPLTTLLLIAGGGVALMLLVVVVLAIVAGLMF